MKFELTSAKSFFDEDQIGPFQELGFVFEKTEGGRFYLKGEAVPEIEFNTLEELVDFADDFDTLIVDRGKIQIFNGYL